MTTIISTGPPFSGKSSVIDRLKEQGYNAVPESARYVLDSLRSLRFKNPHKEKRDLFQREVMTRQLSLEDQNQQAPLVFYDRGIVDNLAYYLLDGLEPPSDIVSLANSRRYDMVFYFKSLEKSVGDRVVTDEEEKRALEKLIKETYLACEYTLIEVPETDVETRVNFILERI